MTFFLVFAVFATAVDPRGAFKSIAGFAIGLTITMDVLPRRPAHRRGDEPGARVRPRAARQLLGARAGSTASARRSARSSPRVGYDRLYLRPLQPPSSARRSPALTSRAPATPPLASS